MVDGLIYQGLKSLLFFKIKTLGVELFCFSSMASLKALNLNIIVEKTSYYKVVHNLFSQFVQCSQRSKYLYIFRFYLITKQENFTVWNLYLRRSQQMQNWVMGRMAQTRRRHSTTLWLLLAPPWYAGTGGLVAQVFRSFRGARCGCPLLLLLEDPLEKCQESLSGADPHVIPGASVISLLWKGLG